MSEAQGCLQISRPMEGSGNHPALTLPGVIWEVPGSGGCYLFPWTCKELETPHKEHPEMDHFAELRVCRCRWLGMGKHAG